MSLLWTLQDAFASRARRANLVAVAARLAPKPGQRVLDVGGGTGIIAQVMLGHQCEVVVLEPDAGKVAYGQEHRPGLRFVAGSAERIPFPDASFDRVLALRSFHHFPQQREALREFRRVLAPGGRLLLEEYAPSSGSGRAVHWWENRLRHHGAAFWEVEDLALAVRAAGFEEPRVTGLGRTYLLDAAAS